MSDNLPVILNPRANAIIPSNIEEVERLALKIYKSKWFPKSYVDQAGEEATRQKIEMAIMHGLELGLTPIAALQNLAIINGVPCIWGDGALALVRARGNLTDIHEKIDLNQNGEPIVAYCTIRRGNQSPLTRSFSVSDAKTAGLWGRTSRDGKPTPWQQYPKRMLQMRARMFALRDGFADVLRGVYGAEEILGEAIDITPFSENLGQPEQITREIPPPPAPPEEEIHAETEPVADPAPRSVTDRASAFWQRGDLKLTAPKHLDVNDPEGSSATMEIYVKNLYKLIDAAPSKEALKKFQKQNEEVFAIARTWVPVEYENLQLMIQNFGEAA